MITKIQSTNNTTNFCALKPLKLGNMAQNILTKANNLSSIHQRLAIGASAFLIQPFIDLRNKEVDKDTRKVSAVRSAAKAIVGTATGIVIRGACMKAAELKYAKKDSAGKIIREAGKIVIDKNKVRKSFGKGFDKLNLDNNALSKAIKRTPSVVGTLAALFIMIGTNFLIDAPLTNKTSDFFEKITKKYLIKENGGKANG